MTEGLRGNGNARQRILVVGDALWDVEWRGTATRLAPDAPVPVIEEPFRRERPGGAALAAVLAARAGHEVTLLTRLGADHSSESVRHRLDSEGVALAEVPLTRGSVPRKMRIGTHAQVVTRVDTGLEEQRSRPMSRAFVEDACHGVDAVLVSDYGRGITADSALRQVVGRLGCPVVWDPHPRGSLPVAGTLVATPNRSEALVNERTEAVGTDARAARLLEHWQTQFVVVTLGGAGAAVVSADDPWRRVRTRSLLDTDACGAGDMFAVSLTVSLAGALAGAAVRPDASVMWHAVESAVASASRFVAEGAATPLALEEGQGRDPVHRRRRARTPLSVTSTSLVDLTG